MLKFFLFFFFYLAALYQYCLKNLDVGKYSLIIGDILTRHFDLA